jgi:hypothetical protein
MYEVPSPEDFRAFLLAHEMTGAQAGKLVGVDSRAVRRWTAPKDQPGSRSIPWAAWILLRLYTGTMTLDEYRLAVISA